MIFIRRLRPQHRAHRQPRNTRGDALPLRFALGQSHTGKWRIRKHTVWNQPVARAALSSAKIFLDDPKIVDRCVCELWAAGTFANGPDLRRARLKPLIDANVATTVQLNTGFFKSNRCGVRNAPGRNQDVASLDLSLAGPRAHDKSHFVSGSAMHMQSLGRHQNLNTFAPENPLHLSRDIRILPDHHLRPGLDNRDLAAESTVSLGQL